LEATIIVSWTDQLKGIRTTSLQVNIVTPSEFAGTYTRSHVFWGTIGADIVGSTFYDDIGLPDYPYKDQLPSPDFKVRIDDVLAAALAFGSDPFHTRWNSLADINGDYKVRVDDILAVALEFGWTSA